MGLLWRLALATLVCGVAAGLIGVAMAYLLEGFEWLFYGVDAGSLPERVAAAPAWRRLLAPAAAGALAGGLWWWERARGGVISVEAVVRESLAPRHTELPTGAPAAARRMGVLRPVGDAILQVLIVGGGNSIGREGAPRLAAGAIAVKVSQWLRLERQWLAILVASAAGAGLAAMYNAPLGGAAYAVEIVLAAGVRRRAVFVAVPVSVLATVVSWIHWRGPAVPIPAVPLESLLTVGSVLGLFATLVAAGLAGWWARTGWAWMRAHALANRWQLPLGIGMAGLLTGLASVWLPTIPGNGRDAFAQALTSPVTLTTAITLGGIVLLKPLLTGATMGAGATGGLLAPSFSLGAGVGALCAMAVAAAGLPISVSLCALAGGAITLAVTQRAPLFAAIFVWEIVKGPWWFVPVMVVACLLAHRSVAALSRAH